jgi:hypothetical protein
VKINWLIKCITKGRVRREGVNSLISRLNSLPNCKCLREGGFQLKLAECDRGERRGKLFARKIQLLQMGGKRGQGIRKSVVEGQRE